MRDIALLVIVVGLLPICFRRPWIGVLVYMWLSFMNPHRLTYGFAYTVPWAFAVAIVTLAGLIATQDRKRIPLNAPMVFMMGCALFFTFTTFFAEAQEPAWFAWDRFAKIILMSAAVPVVIYGRDRITLTIIVAALSIGFYGVKGGIFTLTHGGAFQIRGPEASFIEDNNSLGLALIMVLPLLHWLAGHESKNWLRRVYLVTMWLSLLSAVFTYSRGALVGLAAVAPLLFLRTRKKLLVIMLLVPLVYFGKDLVPEALYSRAESIEDYKSDSSAMLRIQAWGVAWNLALEKPLTGGGFAFEYVPDERWLSYAPFVVENARNYARAAHSIYFQVLGHHGFIGLGLFLAMLLTTLLAYYRIKWQAKKIAESEWVSSLASALQISMVGYMVSGAFLSHAYFDVPYLLIALSAVLQREVSTRGIASVARVAREGGARLVSPNLSSPTMLASKREASPRRS